MNDLILKNPPPRPLLVWDGECHFCRHWIERWEEKAEGRLDFAPYQEVAHRYPEVPEENFQRAVQFFETDGRVFSGAEAVAQASTYLGRGSFRWLYDRVPGFGAVAEFFYRLVASNRRAASLLIRLLSGADVRPPRYQVARELFLRGLGLIYLIAFCSLWMQVDGLFGADGISSIDNLLQGVASQSGTRPLARIPSLFWLNSSDMALHLVCGLGAGVSILLALGLAPLLCLLILFLAYLSFVATGYPFLSFQWDILLLEIGFLALFVAPLSWRIENARTKRVSGIGILLLKLLLFKLMLMSGVVKLTSGDPVWADLTALNYHYWSQPLPTPLAWWADKTPGWFKEASTFFALAVEIGAPFFLWSPRRIRFLAFLFLVALQTLIALTGNYCFFNLLTVLLCLFLLDDTQLSFLRRQGERSKRRALAPANRLHVTFAIIALLFTLPVNAMWVHHAFRPSADYHPLLASWRGYLQPFMIANPYGLFRVMTKRRLEIELEGSSDGIDWLRYEFKWKPGDPARPPPWVAPHQPRLDWQMWFAPFGPPENWFLRVMEKLLHGSGDVSALLRTNPFPDRPPRYVRAILYDYQFTDRAERSATGAWWRRRELREYVPTISLREGGSP